MPKFTNPENQFWTMILKWVNKKGEKLTCFECGKHIASGTKQAQDHYFGISHPGKNIYEIFSPAPLESRTRLRMDGVERLI